MACTAAIAEGRLRIEGSFPADERGSPLAKARRRDVALADPASAVLIAHAHPGRSVER